MNVKLNWLDCDGLGLETSVVFVKPRALSLLVASTTKNTSLRYVLSTRRPLTAIMQLSQLLV